MIVSMWHIASASVVLVFALFDVVQGQNSAQTAVCTELDTGWTFNSLNQSPCVISEYLGGVCTGGQFTIPPLSSGQVYGGPTANNESPCRCNTVYYSVLSACALCQGEEVLRWSSYDANCSTVYTFYPKDIPEGTAIPQYAFENVTKSDIFNATVAESATGPESLGVPKPTGPTGSSSGPQPTGQPVSKTTSHVGAIAGGVVGGVVILVLVVAAALWFIRRQKLRVAPSSLVRQIEGKGSSQPVIQSLGYHPGVSYTPVPTAATPPPRLYNPEDPTTYPSLSGNPDFHTPSFQGHFSNQSSSSFPSSGMPPRGVYTGTPEI